MIRKTTFCVTDLWLFFKNMALKKYLCFFKSEINFYFLDKSAFGKQVLLLDDDYMDIHFFNFLFYSGIELINNVVLVSGIQQSDSIILIHVAILSKILFLCRLLQSIEQSSLCYILGPCWLSVLNL